MPNDTTRRAFLGGTAAAAATLAGLPALDAGADSSQRPPNILILMTDQERHPDRLPPLPTPVRCWMDANGTRLDRFHASSMACSPSRACFWTGMYAPQQGMYGTFLVGNQFTMDPSIPTIGDLMRLRGYSTAFFGKWHLSYLGAGEPPTNVESVEDLIKLNPLEQYGFDYSVISPPSDHNAYNDGFVNDPIWTGQALDFLKAHAGDAKPWFCVLSLLNPHDIQFYPRYYPVDFERPDYDPRIEASYYADPTLADKPKSQQEFRKVIQLIAGQSDADVNDESYWRGLLNTYYDLIVRTDVMLGEAIKAVSDAGALDRTAIFRTADHGELGGAHRLQGKGITIYDEQNRVPFTVVYPKRFARGARSLALGEAVDLIPTLLELAGEPAPTTKYPWLRGRSLLPALDDPSSMGPRDHVMFRVDEQSLVSGFGAEKPNDGHVRQLFDGRYKIARYATIEKAAFAGKEIAPTEFEMYDTWEDPYEVRNLANDRGYEKLRDDLLAWLREREAAVWGPVNLPAFGPRPQLSDLPHVPYTGVTQGGLPVNVWDAYPGNFAHVPLQQPDPLSPLYEGGLPGLLNTGSSAPSAALAMFYCDLQPISGLPTRSPGRRRGRR